jgi:hypothetical protein
MSRNAQRERTPVSLAEALLPLAEAGATAASTAARMSTR